MAPRQRLLDAPLLSHQPVESFVELLLVDRPELDHLAQRAGRRLVIEPPGRRQLGGRINEPRHGHGDAQRHLSVRLPTALGQEPVEPELAQRAQRRRNMTMRQAAQDAQRLLIRRSHRLVAQYPTQGLDLHRRPIRQIGERALLDLVAVAIAFAQQDRGRRIAIGNALDVHGELESSRIRQVKTKIQIYMGTNIPRKWPFRFNLNHLR